MDIYIPFMKKIKPNLLLCVIYIALAFLGAKKVEKSTPCAWKAGLCLSVSRTLTVADILI